MIVTTSSPRIGLVLAVWAAALTGCGGTQPVALSGNVTLDGQPLPEGIISFEPISKTAGQRRDATITNGAFTLPAAEGVLPGMEFKVEIKAFRKTGRKYPNADMGASYDEVVQFIPPPYNSATTLSAVISPDEQANHLSFELVSVP